MIVGRPASSRSWVPVAAAAGFVAVTTVVHIAAGAPTIFLVIETTIALLFIGAGAIAWQRRPTSRTGPLLILCGALWTGGGYNPAGVETLWAVAFAFEGYYDLAIALLALTFPADRLRGAGRFAWWLLAAAFVTRSLGRLLLQDPPRTYPEFVPPGTLVNPFAILESRAAFEVVELVANASVVVLALGVAVVAVRRLLGSASLTRTVIGPVVVGSTIAMLFAAFAALEIAWSTATGSPLVFLAEPWAAVLDWLVPAARAVVPVAFLLGTLRLRSPAGPLATMASRLEREAAPADVDDALVAYIENEQLASRLREQLAELRASRARIVAAADAERQRIERALHDGAQQHLTTVAMQLDEVRRTGGSDPAAVARRLDEIAAELRDAMHELRELARGIHPAILTEAGLGPALATLARRSPIPVDLRVKLDGRMPLPTEVTAYYVVAEALTNVARSSRAQRAEVSLECRGDELIIRVIDDGIGGADPSTGSGIEGLRDRVRALGGQFSLASPPGHGTTVEVWLPCG